ncbi:MAG: glycosyltransferase [Rhodospirillales bacterium]
MGSDPDSDAKPVVSVVIPVLNEEKVVEDNLRTLSADLEHLAGRDAWRIFVVDNNSIDGTVRIVDALGREFPGIVRLHQREHDIGRAMALGLKNVESPYCYIVPIDECDLPFMHWSWKYRDEYDLFIGTKRADPTIYQQTNFRRVLSWGLNALLQLFFEYTGTDTHGPKFMRMDAMRPILDTSVMARGQYDTEFVLKAIRRGLRVVELPVAYAELRPPRNLMLAKIFRNIRDLFRLHQEISRHPHAEGVRIYRYPRDVVLDDADEQRKIGGGET